MYYRLHFNPDVQSVPFYTDRFWQSSWLKKQTTWSRSVRLFKTRDVKIRPC